MDLDTVGQTGECHRCGRPRRALVTADFVAVGRSASYRVDDDVRSSRHVFGAENSRCERHWIAAGHLPVMSTWGKNDFLCGCDGAPAIDEDGSDERLDPNRGSAGRVIDASNLARKVK